MGAYYESFAFDAAGNITSLTRHGHKAGQLAMDAFSYQFDKRIVNSNAVDASGTAIQWDALHTNKLYHVYDAQSDANRYDNDIDDQGTPFVDYLAGDINRDNTYGYDELGNLIRDESNSIAHIAWTLTGKIKSITRSSVNPDNLPDLEFGYNASGTRLYKIVKPRSGGTLSANSDWTVEYYISDASGTVMATYQRAYEQKGSTTYTDQLTVSQHMVYGSSRLGVVNEDIPLYASDFTAAIGPDMAFAGADYSSYTTQTLTTVSYEVNALLRGKKRYEISNHLGNVLAVVQDRKRAIDANNNGIKDYYIPYIVETHDYYAYGSLMEGRGFSSEGYRFGFQGQENENDISGNKGGHSNYKFRISDNRLGRFFAVDPLSPDYPWYAPYQFAGNSTIAFSELEGLEPKRAGKDYEIVFARWQGEFLGDFYNWMFIPETKSWEVISKPVIINSQHSNSIKSLSEHIPISYTDAINNGKTGVDIFVEILKATGKSKVTRKLIRNLSRGVNALDNAGLFEIFGAAMVLSGEAQSVRDGEGVSPGSFASTAANVYWQYQGWGAKTASHTTKITGSTRGGRLSGGLAGMAFSLAIGAIVDHNQEDFDDMNRNVFKNAALTGDWDDMVYYSRTYNSTQIVEDFGSTFVYVYAAMDVHSGEFTNVIPTIAAYENSLEASTKIGFIPNVVYWGYARDLSQDDDGNYIFKSQGVKKIE